MGLVAQLTSFGCMISGSWPSPTENDRSQYVSQWNLCLQNIPKTLIRKFWDLESVGILKGLHYSCCNLWLRGLDHLKDRREKDHFFRDEYATGRYSEFHGLRERLNASVLEQLGVKASQLLNLIKKHIRIIVWPH